ARAGAPVRAAHDPPAVLPQGAIHFGACPPRAWMDAARQRGRGDRPHVRVDRIRGAMNTSNMPLGESRAQLMARFPWPLLRPYTARFFRLFLLIGLGAAAEAVGLVLLSALLNIFLGSRGTPGVASVLAPLYRYAQARPSVFLLLLVAAYLTKSVLALTGTYESFSLAQKITRDWQRRLVEGFLHAPLGRIDTRQGAMVQIVLDEPGSAALGLGAAGLLTQNVLATLTVYLVLLYVSFWATLALTGLAVAAAIMVAAVSRYSAGLGHERFGIFKEGYGHIT